MTPSEYQQQSITTSKGRFGVPIIAYYALGLVGEAGELLEKVIYGENDGIIAELGDVTWYFSGILYEMHIDFGTVPYDEKKYSDTLLKQAVQLSVSTSKIAERIKKLFRDGNGEMSFERQKEIELQMSEILGVMHALARSLGVDMEIVMVRNRQKLLDRMDKNALSGEGDNR
jgi:NTP pyrophosphatase (non-canonical NTP hydrolase)